MLIFHQGLQLQEEENVIPFASSCCRRAITFCSSAPASASAAFLAEFVRNLDWSGEVTVTSRAAGFTAFFVGIKMSQVREILFFNYWEEVRRKQAATIFIFNAAMFCNCVSSLLTPGGVITLDVKNLFSTERSVSFCVVDMDTKSVICSISKLIWNHMKPQSWKRWADNQALKCQIVNERSQTRYFSEAKLSLRHWNFLFSRAFWIAT